jgi:ethanolamine ammonia-lyase large subunit
MNRQELAQIFVLANEFKEGDLLVGGTRDEGQRKEARQALSTLRLGKISKTTLVDDGVSEALGRSLDSQLAAEIAHLRVGDLKTILLGPKGSAWVGHYRDGLSSEIIAAVVKLMTNEELSTVARALFNPLPGEGIQVGSLEHFGSRIQPNSPGDDEEEILFSILEGLTYGCGDVILGLNPASDDIETIIRLEELLRTVKERLALPTRYSVLSDIVKQTAAQQRAPLDVGFQSLAGTSRALFGMVRLDVDGLLDLARGFTGLYFETGQGSAVTNGAAEGTDMVTLEARCYGLARYIERQTGSWMIVNDVAGFIGPEVFQSTSQLLRACLEDTVMAKLHGLTMGLDVCCTFHMDIKPATLRQLTGQIVEQAAPAYLMAVAGNADPMLGYLTTSFREHPRLRRQTSKKTSTAMQKRLLELGVASESGQLAVERPGAELLYAMYMKDAGEHRSLDALATEGKRKLAVLRERGFDLGCPHGRDDATPPEADARLDAIYAHARRALYAKIDDTIIHDASARHLRVRTQAVDRDDYLSNPQAGEMIREGDANVIRSLYTSQPSYVQIVISDGLNADAINDNVREVLPPLRHMLSQAGYRVGARDIVIENGRVRGGYHVGALLGADVIIHLIGERPGTGVNTLSAYLTYGRDKAGNLRWSPGLDHSSTTAICGIHRQGKPPAAAIEEITRCIKRIVEERRSGIELSFRSAAGRGLTGGHR